MSVTVDALARAWYDLLFNYRYVTAEGDIFQELFMSIMERAHTGDFVKVLPWGNKGDLKCDGYLPSERMVFACYGPKEFRPIARALAKVSGDHGGAVTHWKEHMSAWTFVHNEHRGLPPELAQLLLSLGASCADVTVTPWGGPELLEAIS